MSARIIAFPGCQAFAREALRKQRAQAFDDLRVKLDKCLLAFPEHRVSIVRSKEAK